MDKKTLNPHLIRLKKFRKDYFSAFVTWRGIDLKEIGETERSAAFLLLDKHQKWFGITSDQIPDLLKRIAL